MRVPDVGAPRVMSIAFSYPILSLILSGKNRATQDIPGERRTVARVNTQFPVRIKNCRNFTKQVMENMNKTGAFIRTSDPFAVGSNLTVIVDFPEKMGVECEIEVVWRRSVSKFTSSPATDTTAGMGVRFLGGALVDKLAIL